MTDAKTEVSMISVAKRTAEYLRLEQRLQTLLDSPMGCRFIIEDCVFALNEAKIDVGLSGKTFTKFHQLIEDHLADMEFPASELVEKIIKVIRASTADAQTQFFKLWFEWFPKD